uniref:WD_REPEATS_REGION domain-containing protein n=1 Tax=Schistocephalus solidus TaxID=70667 RepID=A0A183SVB8_SCHSO
LTSGVSIITLQRHKRNSSQMASGIAQLKHAFGFRTGINNALAFKDEQTLVYPCGANLVLYNIDHKTQKFIHGLEKSDGMTSMAMSPNRRYVALAEKTEERPLIVIYDLNSLKRRKTLYDPELQSDEFISIYFSPDSMHLISQGGAPDWKLSYWVWQKNKIIASTTTSMGNPIHEVSINPNDSTQMCVTGKDNFKVYGLNDGVIKQIGLSKIDPQHFLCHAWINEEQLAVGTAKGTWILITNGEPIEEHDMKVNILKEGEQFEDNQQELEDESQLITMESATAIVASSKHIFVACGPGLVHCFEKEVVPTKRVRYKQQKNNNVHFPTQIYRRTKEIRIPANPNSSSDTGSSSQQMVSKLVISPSEETLIASTTSHQLYLYILVSPDMGMSGKHEVGNLLRKKDQGGHKKSGVAQAANEEAEQPCEIDHFELLAQAFHEDRILGLDCCIRKPLIATCAADRTVRIWNFETKHLDLYKEFAEEAYSIALHPNGLHVLVGFSDKLRLMNLLFKDIRPFKEFPIRGCKECAFSRGGALFAAVHGNTIQIYSFMEFTNLHNLKAHNGKIRCLLWTNEDQKLISCGMDGAVYEWDVNTGKTLITRRRISENVMKSCSYSCVTATKDGSRTYAVGSDRKIKEISDSTVSLMWYGHLLFCIEHLTITPSQYIALEVDSPDMLLTAVALSSTGRMLFCGSKTGLVRSYKFPFTGNPEWEDYVGHCGQIAKMRITMNDEYLITVSDDSSIMVWELQEREGRNVKLEKEIAWAEEILITKTDLEEKTSVMSELKTRVEELKMENEYQLRLKDMNYSERIKELTEKFIKEMESLKVKNQALRIEKDKEEAKHGEQLQEVMEMHTKELEEIEKNFNEKFLAEHEKSVELQEKAQKMQESYESQISEMTAARDKMLEELTSFFENKLNEKGQLMEILKKENREQVMEHEVTKRLIEEDADREILDMKITYERRLREEREANARLRGESGIMKKKFASLQKEIDDHKEEIKKFHGETQKLNGIIRNLEKDVQGLRKEIQERDETIQDKEKRIYDLKKKNQELEKYKFVLNYKITELKKQIEPRETDIKNYKEQIQEMECELERFHKQNAALELTIVEMKQKRKSGDLELQAERQATRDVEALVRRFKTDLYNCAAKIQDPKGLKESVIALYKKHIQDDMTAEAAVGADLQKEFARQREHLEHSMAGLRKKLAKDSEVHKSDYVRIMHENVNLIEEINKLRAELKLGRNRIRDLEATLGINRRQGEAARKVLERIVGRRPNPVIVQELEEAHRALLSQQKFMGLLHEQIRNEQQCSHNAEADPRPLVGPNTHPLPPIDGGPKQEE